MRKRGSKENLPAGCVGPTGPAPPPRRGAPIQRLSVWVRGQRPEAGPRGRRAPLDADKTVSPAPTKFSAEGERRKLLPDLARNEGFRFKHYTVKRLPAKRKTDDCLGALLRLEDGAVARPRARPSRGPVRTQTRRKEEGNDPFTRSSRPTLGGKRSSASDANSN